MNYDQWKLATPPEHDEQAFHDRWESDYRRRLPIVRCVKCGFECFAGADATIEEHDAKCPLPR